MCRGCGVGGDPPGEGSGPHGGGPGVVGEHCHHHCAEQVKPTEFQEKFLFTVICDFLGKV